MQYAVRGRAVALLPLDTRVPGFRASATYADGFVHAERMALGLTRLDEAIVLNALFDSFDLFAVVAPTVPAMSECFRTRAGRTRRPQP